MTSEGLQLIVERAASLAEHGLQGLHLIGPSQTFGKQAGFNERRSCFRAFDDKGVELATERAHFEKEIGVGRSDLLQGGGRGARFEAEQMSESTLGIAQGLLRSVEFGELAFRRLTFFRGRFGREFVGVQPDGEIHKPFAHGFGVQPRASWKIQEREIVGHRWQFGETKGGGHEIGGPALVLTARRQVS